MVKFTNLVSSLALSLLSLTDTSTANNFFFKRYDNSTEISTSCSAQTSTSVVNVYGPSYTGPVSNAYSTPSIEGEWTNDGPVWSIYIPQSKFNYSSFDLILKSSSGIILDSSAFTFYTGDIDNFINPGKIFTSTLNSLEFNGRTQDPLIKIVYAPSYDNSYSSFTVDFTLDLDLISSSLAKRDVDSFDLSSTVTKTLSSSSSSSSSFGSSVSDVAPQAATSFIFSSDASSSEAVATSEAAISSAATSEAAISSAATSEAAISSAATSEAAISSAATSEAAISSAATSEAAISSAVSPVETSTTFATTILTVTSCSDNECTKETITAVPSVIVTTVNNVEVSYTTYCPISSLSETAASPIETSTTFETTVLTVTSCSDNACTEETVTAVPSIAVTTISDVEVSYTTYCPISSLESSAESSTESSAVASEEAATPAVTNNDFTTTILTVTNCISDECSKQVITAVPSVAVTIVSGIPVSYTTYHPVAVNVPTAKKVTLTTSSVTVDNTVTVITTYCPVSAKATSYAEATTAAIVASSTDLSTPAVDYYTGTANEAGEGSVTEYQTATLTSTSAGLYTISENEGSTLSAYIGAANSFNPSNLLNGIASIAFGLIMLL